MSGHDGRRGYIYHTFVENKVRRTGIGTQLVNAALEALKAEKIRKVNFVVSYWNEEGNAFLEHMGFSVRQGSNYREISLVDPEWIDGIIHMM
jgi:ribosomal protein S18 acetylase RimI-like enzyme